MQTANTEECYAGDTRRVLTSRREELADRQLGPKVMVKWETMWGRPRQRG